MNNREFDRLVDGVRRDVPDSSDAAERVRGRLGVETGLDAAQTSLCASFRGELTPERKMLLRDHVVTCSDCRREHLGLTSNVVTMPKRGFVGRWAMGAVAAALMVGAVWAAPSVLDRVLAPGGARGTVASISGTLTAISAGGASPLRVGAEVAEGQEIRTGKESHAVVRLRDGSLVEMDERSSITLSERWRGKTVRLARGNVIVEAAKQRNGYLQVATSDAMVSVKGTIFGVSQGLGGSRVSVVEGEVRVDEGGTTALLHRGDQKTTSASMERTAVTEDLAWSANAAKYIALLADMKDVSERISRIPMPGLRYSSRLLDRVPVDSVLVAAIPNLGPVVAEATRIFDDKARESAAMREWWTASGATELRKAIDEAKAISDYLGDEIIIAIKREGSPILLAEVRRAGLAAELQRLGYPGAVSFDGSVVAVGSASVPPVGTFVSTPFGAQIADRYRLGAGLLFSANLEQIGAAPVRDSVAGLDNMRFLIAEQKGPLAAPVHSATLSFNGARKGIASWLASPGPMGSLEFVSKDATFAASFLARDPRQLLDEVLTMAAVDRTKLDLSGLDEVAGALGGEVTIAFDGAILPTPAWEVAVELDDAIRLQGAIEKALSVTKEVVDGRTYYSVTATPMPLHYTFVDGYWLLGSSRAQVMRAISNRAASQTLPRSVEFRSQIPPDGQTYFSGLMYYNLGVTVGPIADQLKAAGMLTPELQSQVNTLMTNRTPGLVYVYGEPDRIQVGSRSNLFQMALQALISGNPLTGVPMSGMGGAQ
ncbi:MAG: FecR domain-containing protein [Bryobacteraceae bacterium]